MLFWFFHPSLDDSVTLFLVFLLHLDIFCLHYVICICFTLFYLCRTWKPSRRILCSPTSSERKTTTVRRQARTYVTTYFSFLHISPLFDCDIPYPLKCLWPKCRYTNFLQGSSAFPVVSNCTSSFYLIIYFVTAAVLIYPHLVSVSVCPFACLFVNSFTHSSK